MRILEGVRFLSIETVTLDMEATKMRLRLMMRVFTIKLVTARAEQIPSICRKIGFSLQRPAMKIDPLFIITTGKNLPARRFPYVLPFAFSPANQGK
jgi:hypothetical protein